MDRVLIRNEVEFVVVGRGVPRSFKGPLSPPKA
jgi:hypothetical protein